MDKSQLDEELRQREIERLTSPLKYDENGNAYDIEGNPVYFTETSKGQKYIIEPKEGIITDDDILKYAWNSESAAKVRLNKGIGTLDDKLLFHEDILAAIIVLGGAIAFILITMGIAGSKIILIVLGIIIVLLVVFYAIYTLYLKDYTSKEYKNKSSASENQESGTKNNKEDVEPITNSQNLKRYGNQVNELKQLYEVKEKLAIDMIGKHFSPTEITYDRFMSTLKSCSNLFYEEVDSTLNIINLATDNPKVEIEIKNRIDILKLIIEKVDELTNELVLNMNSVNSNSDEIKYLVEDMEKLIESVKDYKN